MTELKKISNPANPYLSDCREWLGEPPKVEPEVYVETAKSILSKNESPDLGFRWSLNPYRGCFHACSYCYARPTHEYWGFGAGTDFDTKIVVKKNAPQLLEQTLRKRSWRKETIVISGNTDCYQPAEAVWKLTRACLEVCLKYQNPVSLITKSSLIQRDLSLLSELNREAGASVAVSIPFREEKMARLVEPGAPNIQKRFETLARLVQAGVPSGIAVAPIIPGLNDADIPFLLKKAKECGATFAFRTLLRLPGNVKEVFFERLRKEFPLKVQMIENRIRENRGGKLTSSKFNERSSGQGEYWKVIDQTWELWTRKLKLFPEETPLPVSATQRKPSETQGVLPLNFR